MMHFEDGVIASVARSETARDNLLAQNKTVLYLGDRPVILPDGFILPDEELLNERLESLSDYDVVEFYSPRRFQVYYKNDSTDNALVVTTKCNSNCIMCPVPEPIRMHASLEKIGHLCNLIDYMPTDAPFLTITGGEPTMLREDTFILLQRLKDHFEGTKFFFLTNGRTLAINSFFDSFMDVIPEEFRFGIPLYGYDDESHDRITQAKGSFDQTTKAIQKLLNHRCEVEIRIVVSNLNARNMDRIARYIADHYSGLACVNIMATEMCGAAAANKDLVWLDYEDCFRYSKKAVHILLEHGIDVRFYNFPLCKVERSYWAMCSKSITDYKITYYEQCRNCSVKTACGGVFGTTLAVTKMELHPIGDSNA